MKITFFFLFIFTLYSCADKNTKQQILPILGHPDIIYKMVDGKEVADTVYPKIIDFSYLNQDSILIKSSDMKGKIWVADFIFTNCQSICPKMTREMKRLNSQTKDLSNYIQYMSFSIDPSNDRPSVLKKYIEMNEITAKNWYFFTGNEARTHALGIDNFLIVAEEDKMAADGYAHSEAFTLVDREGYVRGVYKVSDPKEVNKLENDIRKLLKYEYSIN
jgi:protein SCO1/2